MTQVSCAPICSTVPQRSLRPNNSNIIYLPYLLTSTDHCTMFFAEHCTSSKAAHAAPSKPYPPSQRPRTGSAIWYQRRGHLGDCCRASVATVWACHNDWRTPQWLQHHKLLVHLKHNKAKSHKITQNHTQNRQ